MSLYLSTEGNASVAIGICGRCSMKFPIVELSPDPNSPGLMVCGTPGRMTGKGSWSGGATSDFSPAPTECCPPPSPPEYVKS